MKCPRMPCAFTFLLNDFSFHFSSWFLITCGAFNRGSLELELGNDIGYGWRGFYFANIFLDIESIFFSLVTRVKSGLKSLLWTVNYIAELSVPLIVNKVYQSSQIGRIQPLPRGICQPRNLRFRDLLILEFRT
jgi:hypothetical protein